MKIEDLDIEDLISQLQGTCMNTIDSVVREMTNDKFGEFDLSSDQLDEIDDNIFNCGECGWWCEICDRCETDGEGDMCEDCYNATHHEEE